MNEVQQYLVDEELEYYRDAWISRREFVKRAAILGAGAAAAAIMAASVSPARRVRAAPVAQRSPDSVAPDDPAVATDRISYRSTDGVELQAYLAWLSKGYAVGQSPPWRGRNAIAQDKLIPIDRLDVEKGKALYTERCQSCHAADGQGVQIGDKKAGPLWGDDSWNDGAGAARVYTLAGIIRYSMPYLDPGSLTDEEAQQVAAYITSQPRPRYPFKEKDYVGGKVPVHGEIHVISVRVGLATGSVSGMARPLALAGSPTGSNGSCGGAACCRSCSRS